MLCTQQPRPCLGDWSCAWKCWERCGAHLEIPRPCRDTDQIWVNKGPPSVVLPDIFTRQSCSLQPTDIATHSSGSLGPQKSPMIYPLRNGDFSRLGGTPRMLARENVRIEIFSGFGGTPPFQETRNRNGEVSWSCQAADDSRHDHQPKGDVL